MLATDLGLSEAIADRLGVHLSDFGGLIQLWVGLEESKGGIEELLEVPVARHRSDEGQEEPNAPVASATIPQLFNNRDLPRLFPPSWLLSRQFQPLSSVEVPGDGLRQTGSALSHR